MEPRTARPPAVFVYLRISQDRDGDLTSVDNQRSDVLALADRQGLVVDQVFVDNDTSAYSGKHRPGYRGLVEAVKRGPCMILVWHMDRLYRRPKELEALLDLVERYPVRLETVRGGGLDLNTHEGQLHARMLVSMASFESGHKADRVRLAARRAAERGEWHGPRRFGYQLDGNRSATIDPLEGPIVRETVDRFLSSESIHSITRWLNGTGVPPLHGGAWHTNTVRQMLAAPRIAGLRSYQPRDRRNPESIFRAVAGPGTWPGIITPEEHTQVLLILQRPERTTTRAGANLLSGFATCGRCGASLVIASSGGRRRYVCKKVPGFPGRGGVSVEQAALDGLICETVLRRLAATAVPARSNLDQAPLVTAVRRARERLTELAAEYGSGVLDRADYFPARDAARGTLHAAEEALSRATSSTAIGAVPLWDVQALQRRWAQMGVGQKRAVVEALVGDVVVMPSARKTRTLDLDRVKLRWRV